MRGLLSWQFVCSTFAHEFRYARPRMDECFNILHIRRMNTFSRLTVFHFIQLCDMYSLMGIVFIMLIQLWMIWLNWSSVGQVLTILVTFRRLAADGSAFVQLIFYQFGLSICRGIAACCTRHPLTLTLSICIREELI